MDPLNHCQFCRARLTFVDAGAGQPQQQHLTRATDHPSPSTSASRHSEYGGATGQQRLEESFVLLDGAVSARRAQAGAQDAGSTSSSSQQQQQQQQQRGLDDSFLLVGSASLLRQPGGHPAGGLAGGTAAPAGSSGPSGGGAGGGGGPHGSQSAVARVPLDPVFEALRRIFQIASEETKVEQPLCLDCAEKVQREVQAQVQELRDEAAAYETALDRLRRSDTAGGSSNIGNGLADGGSGGSNCSDGLDAGGATDKGEEGGGQQKAQGERRRDGGDSSGGGGGAEAGGGGGLAAQLEEARRLEDAERLRLQRAEQDLLAATRELEEAQAAATEVGELEGRYWHDFNDLMLQLSRHVDDRDALLCRTEVADSRLATLRNVNVYSDVFYIWHDGPFGTISGFRLGRTPTISVEWDEINAAWGQAVLLLHTMAQACRLSFSYRLMPMGSYPRVADRKAVYDLFGPVSKLYCTSYDRAMACFLTCLKEFAMFAAQRDRLAGRRQVFELPYSIDGAEVGALTIKLMFNKDARWTKALKYMLTDLKWCLEWMVVQQEGGAGECGRAADSAAAGEQAAA